MPTMGSTEIKLWQDEELIEMDRKIDELEEEINSKNPRFKRIN